jgi:hypothetical protein
MTSMLPTDYTDFHKIAVVTVLDSSEGRSGFEGIGEGEEEFSHDSSEGQFGRFAFGAQMR